MIKKYRRGILIDKTIEDSVIRHGKRGTLIRRGTRDIHISAVPLAVAAAPIVYKATGVRTKHVAPKATPQQVTFGLV